MKEWHQHKQANPIPHDFCNKMGISPRFASIFWDRGIENEQEIKDYLHPHLRYLEQPHKWPNIQKAGQLLADALIQGKKLVVWGDYDVDGVTGVALVVQVISHFGFPIVWHLPDRTQEGYGLNSNTIEKLASENIEILLTVDCGISDVEAVKKAREHNMLVIISDHHLVPEVLPDAHALCNPHLADCPCNCLAGVGVAFFLMAELNSILSVVLKKEKLDMRECLDLVALGTLADMVPLEGQNRILVKNGLLKIKEAKRLGLAALKSVSNFHSQDELSPKQIVFNLAPRINAAGRMASARSAANLLISQDKVESMELANILDEYNQKRKLEEKGMSEEALNIAATHQNDPILFVMNETWNQGIVGIVASRLVEKYYKPAFVFCKDGNNWKGSARSIPTFDLHAGLVACEEYLETYGGHHMAAGLRIAPHNMEKFQQAYIKHFQSDTGNSSNIEHLFLDGELNFSEATNQIFRKELLEMEPFGMGNKEPLFASPPLFVQNRSTFGYLKNHVKLHLIDESTGISLHVKVWQKADKFPAEIMNRKIKIAYTPSLDMQDTFSEFLTIRDWKYEL